MKYLLLLSGLLVGYSSCKTPAKFPYKTDGKSLLWEVTGNGLSKPTYIYGTMHIMCPEDAKPGKNLTAIINAIDEIYFEIDMDNMVEMMGAAFAGKMRGDTTLKDLFTEDEYKRINDFFVQHKMGAQFSLLGKMQPLLVGALVYQVMMPCPQMDGVEMAIMKEAAKTKKEIKGLETAAFQSSVIDKIPYKEQAKDLLNSIDSIEQNKPQLQEMIAVYKQGDVDSLAIASMKGEYNSEQAKELLLDSRNRNWANKFGEITKGKSLLVAVGAGHLGGKQGLLNLLKAKGYSVKAVVNE